MSNELNLDGLSTAFVEASSEEGLQYSAELLEGEVPVLQVSIADREEFPVYITIDDSQALCVTYLWTEDDVKPECRQQLLDDLLVMNLPMPLSAFSKIGSRYVIFGALSTSSSVQDVISEVETLSDNTLEVFETIDEYLQESVTN